MEKKIAGLYRMFMPEHLCPFGLKSKYLLSKAGYSIEDNRLTSREETEKFKQRVNVQSTPQIWLDQQHIGGYDELR